MVAAAPSPAKPKTPRSGDRRNRALGGNLPDDAVPELGDVQIARGIDCDPTRGVDLGAGSRPAVSAVTNDIAARHGADVALRVHFPDDGVSGVGDEQVPARINGHVLRIDELRGLRRPSVTPIAESTRSGRGRDIAAHREFPDDAASGVRDVDVSGPVDRQARGRMHLRIHGGVTIPRVPADSVAGDSRDGSAGSHHANDIVRRIGDVNISGFVERHALRDVQLGGGGRTAVAGVSGPGCPRDQGEHPGRIHFEYRVRAAEIQIPGAVDGRTERQSDSGSGCRDRRRWRRSSGERRYRILLGEGGSR